jgi:hypothetical protein
MLRLHPKLFAVAVSGASVFALFTVAASFAIRWIIDQVILPRFEEGSVATGSVLTGMALVIGIGVVRAAAVVVRRSFAVITAGSTPAIAAAFTYGREDVIPDMFRGLVARLAAEDPVAWGRFRFYLERHIEHDDEHHAPVCRRIVARLCGSDATAWAEAQAAARECLAARIALWDAIAAAL